MKKMLMLLVVFVMAITFVGVGIAGGGKIHGELVKVEGEFFEIKDDQGKMHKLHFDRTTKQTGDIKAGAKVEAEATEMGHTKSIMVMKDEGMKK